MPTTTINIAELSAQKRWNLSYLLADNGAFEKRTLSGYPRLPIGQLVLERKQSLNPQDFKNHLFNYVGLENIEPKTGLLVQFSPQQGENVLSRSKVFFEGDILYGRLRPNLNKVLLVDETLVEGICSTEFYVLTPLKDKILPLYLRYMLASGLVLEKVCLLTAGTALPRIQWDDFSGIEIPIPPLDFQIELETYLQKAHAEYERSKHRYQKLPELIFSELTNAINRKSTPEIQDWIFPEEEKTVWHNPLPNGAVPKNLSLF